MTIWQLYKQFDYEGCSPAEHFWMVKPSVKDLQAASCNICEKSAEALIATGSAKMGACTWYELEEVKVIQNA